MGKHAFVLAFLIGGFAAAGSLQAIERNEVILFDRVVLESQDKPKGKLIKQKGNWFVDSASGSQYFVSVLSNGLKVVNWEYAQLAGGNLNWQDLKQDGTNVLWTYKAGMTTVYLRPILQWLRYPLSYDGNGGSGSMEGQGDVRYDTKVTLPDCGFTRTGYSFVGWSPSKSGGTVWPAGTACDGHDFGVDAQNHDYGKDGKGTPVTLSAQWEPNQYTVTFDANCPDGSCEPSSKKVTYDSTYGDLPTPTRPAKERRSPENSWQFDGWYDSEDHKVTSATKVTIIKDVTLYARWTEIFEVRYLDDSKFGSGLLKTEYVANGGTTTPPSNPAHPGYSFAGWSGYNSFSGVGQNRDYTASYSANGYTVVFHSSLVPDTTQSQNFVYGTSQSLKPNTFVNAGHTFLGWAETAGSRTVKWEDETPVTDLATGGTVNLYAVWDANAYTIAFDGNGGTGAMKSIDMIYGVATNLPKNVFVYDGLDFKSWRDELNKTNYLDGATVSNLTTEAGGTVTLKAVWFEGYFVEFDGGKGASGEMPRQQFSCGVDVALPRNEFTKKGYTFNHWTNTQGKVIADGAIVKDLAPMGETATLYAVWEANKYYIRFDDNGANDGDMPVQEFTYDQGQYLYRNSYTNDFHNFIGWGLTADATVPEYIDEDYIFKLTSEPDKTNVFYAVWASSLSDLSRAANCENLDIRPGIGKLDFSEGMVFGDWVVDADVHFIGNSSCRGSNGTAMNAEMPCSGELKYKVRNAVIGSGQCVLYKNQVGQSVAKVIGDTAENWTDCSVRLEKGDKIAWVAIAGGGGVVTSWVDGVVWEPDGVTLHFDANGGSAAPSDLKIPLGSRDKLPREVPTRSGYAFKGWRLEGGDDGLYQPRDTFNVGDEIETIAFTAVWEATSEHPVPEDGEDNVTISSAAVSDGKFTLSFKSDERFDYNLLTNGNLLIKSWGIMETRPGTGEPITFEPEIGEGLPQLFYKVETIQKK